MARFTMQVLDAILARTPAPLPMVAIETGTWTGDTTLLLAERFDAVYTIDIDPRWYGAAQTRFMRTPHVYPILGDSATALGAVLKGMAAPVLLYLDAHWWAGHGGYEEWSPFPLWGELQAACASKWPSVVVVDDIYQMGQHNDPNPGWPGATQEAILAVMAGRVVEHAVIEDGLVAWWNGEVVR